MAKKVDKPVKKSLATEGASDLEVLHPDRTISIAGRQVTVREYRFVEGLRLRPVLQPLLDRLHDLMQSEGVPSLDAVELILGEMATTTNQLILAACDLTEEELNGLGQEEGQMLMDVWWTCNGPFFLRKVIDRLRNEMMVAKARAGRTSTSSSSSTGTGQSKSGSTPGGKSSFTSEPPPAPKTDKEANT